MDGKRQSTEEAAKNSPHPCISVTIKADEMAKMFATLIYVPLLLKDTLVKITKSNSDQREFQPISMCFSLTNATHLTRQVL